MSILFIGAGNMAEAMINGLISNKIFKQSNITACDIDEERLKYLKNEYEIVTILNNKDKIESIGNYNIIVLSIKPNLKDEVLKQISSYVLKDTIIVSIMAGISIDFIKKYLPSSKVFRAMPNTPALLGKGMSVLSFNDTIPVSDIKIVQDILCGVGRVLELDEKNMDAVTAISGSGPAYLFYLTELMIGAGIDLGLKENVAIDLSIETIVGASCMLRARKNSPKELREKVSSPNGTTEAAINYLRENKFDEIFLQALKKAKEKSVELSKN